jgi:hypothetical protein
VTTVGQYLPLVHIWASLGDAKLPSRVAYCSYQGTSLYCALAWTATLIVRALFELSL